MSKQAIIDKINADASDKAQQIVAEQQAKADEISAQVTKECEDLLAAQKKALDENAALALERSRTVAQLDARKIVIGARKELVDRVFARALEKLNELDAKTAKKLLLGMLKAAEDGDSVLLGSESRKALSDEDIAAFAKKKGVKLQIDDGEPGFEGGMILSGGGIDKNLTFEVELELMRDECEAEIAAQILS